MKRRLPSRRLRMDPKCPWNRQWKGIVRKFWEKPLCELDEKALLNEGELTLTRGVSRKQFLDSFKNEDDDFARGMEWRAVGDTDSELGDIVIIRLPNAPHESAAAALVTAVNEYIVLKTPSPSIRRSIVPTGATRCTGGARSSESDGGFAPIDSPINTFAGAGDNLFELRFANLLITLRHSFADSFLRVCLFALFFMCSLQ